MTIRKRQDYGKDSAVVLGTNIALFKTWKWVVVVTLFPTVQIHKTNNLLLNMYNIRLPVATREAIAHGAGGQHQNIKGAYVAIVAVVPRYIKCSSPCSLNMVKKPDLLHFFY